MLMRERHRSPLDLLPAPLPNLTAAFSRRAAIFGAVVAPMVLPGRAARAAIPVQAQLISTDARLVAWCDELPGIDAALSDLFARAPDVEADARIDALLSLSYRPAEFMQSVMFW